MLDFVKVVNRSDDRIVGLFDGRRIIFQPHEEKMLPPHIAELCKRQNPIMGTEDVTDIVSSDHLLAIPEWGDEVTPANQSEAVELLDRESIVMDQQEQVVELTMRRKGKQHRASVAPNLKNPTGIQASYED